MKRYRLKPRFYVIVATTAILLTTGAVVHIDATCRENIETGRVIKPVYAVENLEIEEPGITNLGEFVVTHYCSCPICCGEYGENRPIDEEGEEIVYTSTGEVAVAGQTIAVDPEVIPYGTEVVIDGQAYVAQDTGGAIKGNRIDVYCNSHEEALERGVFTTDVYTE
jgi:3D (Asp-Asp-Asp) domain-containing protein